jgi:hypothetical protein
MENSGIFKTMKHSDHYIVTIDILYKISMIVTGWHEEQGDFQNNEKTMEHSDHWIMTGWHYYTNVYYINNFEMITSITRNGNSLIVIHSIIYFLR